MLSMMTAEITDEMIVCWWWDVIKSVDEENENSVWSRTVSKLLYEYKITLTQSTIIVLIVSMTICTQS